MKLRPVGLETRQIHVVVSIAMSARWHSCNGTVKVPFFHVLNCHVVRWSGIASRRCPREPLPASTAHAYLASKQNQSEWSPPPPPPLTNLQFIPPLPPPKACLVLGVGIRYVVYTQQDSMKLYFGAKKLSTYPFPFLSFDI